MYGDQFKEEPVETRDERGLGRVGVERQGQRRFEVQKRRRRGISAESSVDWHSLEPPLSLAMLALPGRQETWGRHPLEISHYVRDRLVVLSTLQEVRTRARVLLGRR
jgi:hypothetical protein